jgi:putative tryptophan/tyrosine transport system substrate-binding protein
VAAAKKVTMAVPIVFAAAGDPVGTGLVASLARPGANITGLSIQQTDLAGKRLEILREALPGVRTLGIVANAGTANAVLEMRETEAAASKYGLDVVKSEIRSADDLAAAIEALKGRTEALYFCALPCINDARRACGLIATTSKNS